MTDHILQHIMLLYMLQKTAFANAKCRVLQHERHGFTFPFTLKRQLSGNKSF